VTKNGGKERRRRWGTDRRGIGSVTAAAILGVVVVAVGAVGYVVLNALEHATTTSSTVHSYSCTPPTDPQCAAHPGTASLGPSIGGSRALVASR